MATNEPITSSLIAIRNKQAGELFAKGRFEEALALAEESVRLANAHLAETDLERAKAICNLASFQGVTGNAEQAIETFGLAMQAMLIAAGENHPLYGRTLGNVGSFFMAQGRTKEAELLFARSLSILSVSESNADHFRDIVWELAGLHNTLSKFEKAKAISQPESEFSKKLGEAHFDRTASTLGQLEELKGMPAEMRKFGLENIESARQHFGSMSTHAEALAIVDLRREIGEPFAVFLRGFEGEAYAFKISDPKHPFYPSMEDGASVSAVGKPSKVESPLTLALRGKLSALAVASPATIDPGQTSQGGELPRLILPNESWLDIVRSLIKRAHLIVVDCYGLNSGVKMEIEAIVECGMCENTVVLLHKDRSELDNEHSTQLAIADIMGGKLESSSSHEWVTREHDIVKPFRRIGYVEDFAEADDITSSDLFADLIATVPLARSATRLGKEGTKLIETGNIIDGLHFLRASLLLGNALSGWAERATVESNYELTLNILNEAKQQNRER